MKKKYHEQQNQMEEGFAILSALINENRGQSFTACANAFKAMHNAFVFSLETERTDYEWMFNFLRQYISDFKFQTFTSGYAQLPDGRIIINVVGENEGKTLKEVVDNYLEPIKKDEQQIRSNKNFCKIQIEYNRVMKLFYKRMEEIVTNPEKQLTQEEQEAIINPQ